VRGSRRTRRPSDNLVHAVRPEAVPDLASTSVWLAAWQACFVGLDKGEMPATPALSVCGADKARYGT
jgi:hypothetical protein